MTRRQFLALTMHNPPHCGGSAWRSNCDENGKALSYLVHIGEDMHHANGVTDFHLNIFWKTDETVDVGFYDGKEKNPWKKYGHIIEQDKHFTQEKLTEIINKYLGASRAELDELLLPFKNIRR